MLSVSLPPWGLALVLAAGAPFVVRLLAESLSKRKQSKTQAFLARARRSVSAAPPGRSGGTPALGAFVAEATDPALAEVRRTSWHD